MLSNAASQIAGWEATKPMKTTDPNVTGQQTEKQKAAGREFAAMTGAVLLAIALWCGNALAQTTQPQQPQPTPQATQAKVPAAKPEQKISKAEADELFRSVDQILQFVSKDTGLPIKHPVKRKLASREEVVKYLEDNMKGDEDTKRMESSAVTLEKLGLLPRGFALRDFLLKLLKEQVAGYYDTKTKTVYLLDWVGPEAQKPVLAHELTHALQDQNFNLKKWSEVTSAKHLSDQQTIDRDEERAARQAVVEGQAMVTLLDYYMAPEGRSVADSPAIVKAIQAGMLTGGSSPMFAKAPMFLQESLVFPYMDGLDFEGSVLRKLGKQGAFAGVFKNPPEDTRQIMQPETYLAHEVVPQMKFVNLDKVVGKSYKRYDFGGLGEFDIYLLVRQWVDIRTANEVSKGWRGGYYLTYRKKDDKPGEAEMALVTKWPDRTAAEQFASIYAGSLKKRYKQVRRLDDGSGFRSSKWMTEQGEADIDVVGKLVVVTEGFDDTLAAKLKQAMVDGDEAPAN